MAIPGDVRLFALVPAAGVGARMGAGLPKQYLSLRGRTLAEQTLSRLLAFGRIERCLVAVAQDDPWWPELDISRHPRVSTVTGGDSRAASVLNGLEHLRGLASDSDWVLVHDMARPCVRLSDIDLLLAGAGEEGAILALQSTDTIKEAREGVIQTTLARERVWRALTPQLFPLGLLHRALSSAVEQGHPVTDEASAVESLGLHPLLVAGHGDNIKVTLPDDLALAAWFLEAQESNGLARLADSVASP